MYRKIDLEMWDDEKFRELSAPLPSARSLWMYLLTGRHTTALPGLVVGTPRQIFAELGWPADEYALAPEGQEALIAARQALRAQGFASATMHGYAALAELETLGMIQVFEAEGVIWIPNAMKRNPPQSLQAVRAWRKAFDSLPGSLPGSLSRKAIGEATGAFLAQFGSPSWLAVWTGDKKVGNTANLRKGPGSLPGSLPRKATPVADPDPSISSIVVNGPSSPSGSEGCPANGVSRPDGATAEESEGDLFSAGPAPRPKAQPRPPKPRAKRVPRGEYQRFVDGFQELFVAARGVKPTWGEKQGAQVKQLLRREGGCDAALVRAARMFDMAGQGWPTTPDLGTLVSCWDKFAPPVQAKSNFHKVAPNVNRAEVYAGGKIDMSKI